MDIQSLMLAYTGAALVALGVVAAFSASIEHMLFRLLDEDLAPHWAQFVKFAVAVAAFAGGLPARTVLGVIDRTATAPPPPPGAADGIMLVMGSVSGALMAGAWALLLVFAGSSLAIVGRRAYIEVRRYRAEQAKKSEPAEARPAPQEKPEPQLHRRH